MPAPSGQADPAATRTGDSNRRLVFGAISALCLAVAIGYVAWVSVRARPGTGSASPVGVQPSGPSAVASTPAAQGPSAVPSPSPGASAAPATQVAFQNVIRGDGYARIAVATAGDPNGPRTLTGPVCERVYVAAARGLCLGSEFGLITTYYADVLDNDMQPVGRVSLDGPPSRARISPDGRFGATTVFVFGHSYADANFSTTTTIIDMASARTVANLEDFEVEHDGQSIRAPDFNFWGVTFAADSNKFYATLRTGGKTYLVEGDIAAKRIHTIAENVECPSLSPDGTRIAYKKLIGEGPQWRLHVLDLASMAEVTLAEQRSVDDQAEWVDDGHVTYAVGEDLWVVPSDGTGSPSLFIAHALSPAVIR